MPGGLLAGLSVRRIGVISPAGRRGLDSGCLLGTASRLPRGLSAGHVSAVVCSRSSGLGKSGGDRESLTNIFLGCEAEPKKGSPSGVRLDPALPCRHSGGGLAVAPGETKVKTLLIDGPPGAPSKPRESLEPQGLSSGPRAGPGEQDSFQRLLTCQGHADPVGW